MYLEAMSTVSKCNGRQAALLAGKVHSLSDATLQRLAASLREPLGFDRAKAEWLAERLLQASEDGVLVAPNVLLDAYSRAKVRSGASTARILQTAAECLVGQCVFSRHPSGAQRCHGCLECS